MFRHNFIYSLKVLFRNKMLIFWTFAFPIILGILFNLAFSDIEKNESLDVFNVAVVETKEYRDNQLLVETFEYLGNENNDDQLFEIEYVPIEKADELLKEEKIVGYLLVDDEVNVIIKENGIYETIFKTAVDQILQSNIIVTNMQAEIMSNYENKGVDYQQIYQEIMNKINEKKEVIVDISNSNLSYTMIEYYTLIAMSCLYGGLLGCMVMKKNLANMGSVGMRMAITPIAKLKMIISSVLAGYLTQLIGVFILLLFTIFCFKVDYGENIPLIILLILVGSLAGLAIGIAIASFVKANDNVKVGLIIAVTMLGCFLSGMMGITMKYIIDTNLSILNKINPASMITDGFYALYYYDTLERYWFDVLSLGIFAVSLIIISFVVLRRQRYDSI